MGLVHRLDRTSSGVIVFAKTSKALSRLNKQFKNREVLKTYWAIVEGKDLPKKEKLINWVRKNKKKNKSFVFENELFTQILPYFFLINSIVIVFSR